MCMRKETALRAERANGFIERGLTIFDIKPSIYNVCDGRPEWINELPMGIYGACGVYRIRTV